MSNLPIQGASITLEDLQQQGIPVTNVVGAPPVNRFASTLNYYVLPQSNYTVGGDQDNDSTQTAPEQTAPAQTSPALPAQSQDLFYLANQSGYLWPIITVISLVGIATFISFLVRTTKKSAKKVWNRRGFVMYSAALFTIGGIAGYLFNMPPTKSQQQ